MPDRATATPFPSPAVDRIGPDEADVVSDEVVERYQRFAGSLFVALFATALFDQVALPSVAAGVESTGRIRYRPFERGARSAAADQLVFLAPDADSNAETERLVRLHRDVKGTSPDGVHFSALHPESWNWILLSTFFMYRGAFATVTGTRLTSEDDQAIWDTFRTSARGLQHPDPRFALPRRYSELVEHYDRMATERCRPTDTLRDVVAFARRPTPPPSLPAVAKPLWNAVVAPVSGRALSTIGFGIMHPEIRRLAGIDWGRRERLEFAALTQILQAVYPRLPDRLVLTPLAYHRRKTDQLVRRYRNMGLDSFAPDEL
jgi:uncharacterized protein (DUF2236 family)